MSARITSLRADEVLHELVAASDIFDVGGRKFMVAILTDQRIEDLVVALAEHEDAEPDSDAEPSLGYSGGDIYSVSEVDAEGPDVDAEPDLDEGDGDCESEPDHEGPDGDEGDYSGHQLEPVDHDIRMMLRDNIERKRVRQRRPVALAPGGKSGRWEPRPTSLPSVAGRMTTPKSWCCSGNGVRLGARAAGGS